jgi:uncharacterized repeat protein (TIGR01451 family)
MSRCWSSRFRRRGLLGLAAVPVMALAIAVAAAQPAGGQVAPTFSCNGDLFITTGSPSDMTLTRVDQLTGALTEIGDGGLVANGLGYDPDDDYLYGMSRGDPHTIVRVAADGTETALGAATGTPASWELTFVGTFLPNGNYLVLGDNASPPTSRGTVSGTWAEIDLSTSPPHVIRTFSHPSVGNNDLQDVAVNPVDGQLYAHSTVQGRIVRIDPSTGAATPVGPRFDVPDNAGSSFFDSFGQMWLYGSGSTPGSQDTLYRIDDIATEAPVVVEEGPAVTNSDGASCPYTIGMEKTVDPAAACAGDRVTYRYTISNRTLGVEAPEAAQVVTADFVDDLPDDGRTFVAGTLVDPPGGHVGAYGGTDELMIDGLQIPGNTTSTIEVDVALPPGLPPGTVTNQAELNDLSGNIGSQVLSEFPGTPPLPDPTPLEVQSCLDLGIDKRVDATVAGPGDELTYSLVVTNLGPSDATGVDSVSDTLPEGLEFVSASDGGAVGADGTVRWPAFDLAAGADQELTVATRTTDDVRTVTADDGDLDNTATVRHPGDSNPANDRDSAEVPVDSPPDLVVDKDDGRRVVDPGEEVTYAITVRNVGQGDATGVRVTDQLPGMLEFISGSDEAVYEEPAGVVWPAFDLAAGADRELTVTARVAGDAEPGTRVRNVALAPHPDDPNPDDNRDDDEDDVDGRPPPPIIDGPDGPHLPTGLLPRTGLASLSLAAIGAGLIALGSAGWWTGRRPRSP